MVKKKDMICYVCKDVVAHNEHYVQLSTYNRKIESKALPDDHNYFHMRCFKEFFDKRVNDRAREQVQFMQQKALEVMKNPLIANVINNFKGAEALKDMLNTDLTKKKDIVVTKEKVVEKIYDDRRKARRKRKRKTSLQ
jgi:hypothetical protein